MGVSELLLIRHGESEGNSPPLRRGPLIPGPVILPANVTGDGPSPSLIHSAGRCLRPRASRETSQSTSLNPLNVEMFSPANMQ